jgi:replicative DNA helicase
MHAARLAMEHAGDQSMGIEDVRDAVAREFSTADKSLSPLIDASDAFLHALDADKSRPPIPTGIKALDAIIRGLPRGLPTVIAARPKMGKSSLALQCAVRAARDGLGVFIVSAEMDQRTVVRRMVSHALQLPYHQVCFAMDRRAGAAYPAIAALGDEIASWQMVIDDAYQPTADMVRRRAKSLLESKRLKSLDLVIVDYFGTLKHPGGKRDRSDESQRRSSDVLRVLAKETGAAVVVVSQLNRRSEGRQNPRPIASDVREADALVEHAGLVISPFRPSVYAGEGAQLEVDPSAEICVLASRETQTGRGAVEWNGKTYTFNDKVLHYDSKRF